MVGVGARRRAAQITLFAVLTAAIYLATADYDQEQNFDVLATAIPVWSLVERGTLDVQPYQDLAPWFFEADGRWVSNRWPGTMVFAFPAYAIVHLAAGGTAAPVLWPATVAAALVAAAAATALFALLLAEHGPTVAWVAGSIAAFGTGLWTVAAEALWTHAPGVLMVALTLHALRSDRQWLAGCWLGCLGLIRLHLLAAAALIGYVLAREQRDARVLLRLGIPAAIGLLAFLCYAGALTGVGRPALLPYAFEVPQGGGRLLNAVGALAAPRVGVLLYTPVLVCCVPRLADAWRAAPAWERAAFFGGAVYLIIQFQSNFFFGGYGYYGYRLPLEGLTFALPMLGRSGLLFARQSPGRARSVAVLGVSSVWTSAVGALFFAGTKGRDLDPWRVYGPIEALGRQPWFVAAVAVAVGLACVVTAALAVGSPTASDDGHTPAAL